MDIFSELTWRGLIHQTTDEKHLAEWLAGGSRTVYVGFDPTASSLHVGSLMPLMTLRRFQQAGHHPLALVGGATGMIGDPSGKNQERNLLSADALEDNVQGLKSQMLRFLDFSPGSFAAVLVNNFDWMRQFSYLDFLRDIGKNFPVNVMLAKDSVKSRIGRDEGGISYTEFSYMLLQAYDFVHLYDEYGCELQIGGSDQWGNITAGIDLARRMRNVQLYGITSPLLTKVDGSKMGKTESGTVWLSPERTSPYAFYQYWINIDDADIGMCLRYLTELEHEEIEALDASRIKSPHLRESQKRVAEELTRLVHGSTGLASAQRASATFFGAQIDKSSDEQLLEIFADVPSKELVMQRLTDDGLNVVDAMVEASLAKSKGEARRTVQQGGAYVNNRRVDSIETKLTTQNLVGDSIIVLRSGKKKYALLRFVR
ncbi:MAG TPA: tyrosine--tRNA ligase [Nitrospirales bacterium]|nr:tyrosine--tRNA ligase [Nitrospirales bacterium]